MCHENYAQCKIYVYVSIDTTADAASWSTLAAFILALEKSEQKVWMHFKLLLGSAKPKAVQEAQNIALCWCSCIWC